MKSQGKRAMIAGVIFAASGLALATGRASADTIDCVYDGYVAMGGMVFNTTNSYLLPSYPYSEASSGMETFGYAFLKFDAADLPTSSVGQALLQLDVIALQSGMSWPVEGTGSVGVHAVTADVAGITSVTAASFRSNIAVAVTDSVSVTGEGLVSLDVTDIVNQWIASGNNYGLVLTSPGGLMPRLHSAQTVSGAAPSISVVPEPATLGALTICGMVGVIARRRRHG
jgi:hypothetical protein